MPRASNKRNGKPKTPVAGDGRERILAVALRSFAELGYEGATTAEIARQARVTQPLVHHHFGSKEGLWHAAMDHLFSELRIFTALDPRLAPKEALLRVVEQFARLSAARPELARIIAREGQTPGPRLEYLVDRYLRPQFKTILAALTAEQQAGRLDPDARPELLLLLVAGAASHLFDIAALAKQAFGIDVTSPQVRDEFVSLLSTVVERGVVRQQGKTE